MELKYTIEGLKDIGETASGSRNRPPQVTITGEVYEGMSEAGSALNYFVYKELSAPSTMVLDTYMTSSGDDELDRDREALRLTREKFERYGDAAFKSHEEFMKELADD